MQASFTTLDSGFLPVPPTPGASGGRGEGTRLTMHCPSSKASSTHGLQEHTPSGPIVPELLFPLAMNPPCYTSTAVAAKLALYMMGNRMRGTWGLSRRGAEGLCLLSSPYKPWDCTRESGRHFLLASQAL